MFNPPGSRAWGGWGKWEPGTCWVGGVAIFRGNGNKKRRGWSHSDSPWRRCILGICGWNVFCLLALFLFLWINWGFLPFAHFVVGLSFFLSFIFIFIFSSPHLSHPPPLPIVEASLDSLWFYLLTLPFADVSALLTGDENHTALLPSQFLPRVLYRAIEDVENLNSCILTDHVISLVILFPTYRPRE